MVAVPTTLAPLYNVTVLLGSAVPAISIEGALLIGGAVVVITGAAGEAVSMMAATGPALVVLPSVSVATAVKACGPSESGVVVKFQEPEPSIVAAPRSDGPSIICTETMPELTEPESVGVLSLVTPPLAMVGACPVSVEIVVLIVPLGGGGGVDVCRIIASAVAPLVELAVGVISGGGVKLTVVSAVCIGGGMLVNGGWLSGPPLSGVGGVELPGLGPDCGFGLGGACGTWGPCGACGPCGPAGPGVNCGKTWISC